MKVGAPSGLVLDLIVYLKVYVSGTTAKELKFAPASASASNSLILSAKRIPNSKKVNAPLGILTVKPLIINLLLLSLTV